jgi:propanol-preferring alcohol dehydrogenase
MKAMVLREIGAFDKGRVPLKRVTLPDPVPAGTELLLRVSACAVCRTELDEIEGRTPPPRLPIVLGHQAVGRVEATARASSTFRIGDRVGVAWIYSACGTCRFCRSDRENLCPSFRATGREVNGGYAQYLVVPEAFAHRIPEGFGDAEAAPLLCAGAIGYRSLMLAGLEDGGRLGLMGFGASAHLVLKMARHRMSNVQVFAFARSERERAFARELGAAWAGDIAEECPEKLDAIIDTTPAWRPLVEALKNLERGGRLVVNAIGKEAADQQELLRLDYATHLWLERRIQSVANVRRDDVREFLALAADMRIRPEIQEFALEDANEALAQVKEGLVRGAKVLRVD